MNTSARLLLSAATAAFLTVSAAAPAEARPYGRHHRHHDRIDAGDVLLGAILLGGIVAVASAASKDRGRNEDWGRDGERAAVEQCADAAEREAQSRERDARVTDITDVQRSGEAYRVRGVIDYRSEDDDSDDRRWDDYRDNSRFTCIVRYGRIQDLRIEDDYAWR